VRVREPTVPVVAKRPRLDVDREPARLHVQRPTESGALAHELDQRWALLQARIVVQGGPDLRAHLLQGEKSTQVELVCDWNLASDAGSLPGRSVRCRTRHWSPGDSG